jgi:hypothetical protein
MCLLCALVLYMYIYTCINEVYENALPRTCHSSLILTMLIIMMVGNGKIICIYCPMLLWWWITLERYGLIRLQRWLWVENLPHCHNTWLYPKNKSLAISPCYSLSLCVPSTTAILALIGILVGPFRCEIREWQMESVMPLVRAESCW